MAQDAIGHGPLLYRFKITAPAGYEYTVNARGNTASHAREAVQSFIKRNEPGGRLTFIEQMGKTTIVKQCAFPSPDVRPVIKLQSLWDIINFGV